MIAKHIHSGFARNLPWVPAAGQEHDAALGDVKAQYREFSRSESSLPIFSRDWWLDATAGPDHWNAAVVTKGGQVVAAMPYTTYRRYWLKVMGQPALTQKLGPWLRLSEGKPATRLAGEKDLMQGLIDQLPRFDYFTQNWHHSRTNWLPFAWNGFHQTTRYTYVLNQLQDTDKLWAGFQHKARTEYRKAFNRFRLTIRDDLPLEAFLALNRMTFARQRMEVPYSDAFVRRLDAACAERGCRKFFIAVDPEGRHLAGLYIVWDEESAYGLMVGSHPALRNTGAISFCFWHAIQYAARVTKRFDFAGSMLEPVERFFRSFGATQVPYFHITSSSSKLVRISQAWFES